MGALISNEHGYSGMQGRGFFAGVSGYGFHAEYSQNGGFDWGGSTKLAEYYLENNGSKQKWVGVNVMGFQVARYDHDARNENQPNFKTREEFEKYARENKMTVGIYPEDMSVFHEEGVKMWMAPKGDEPFYFEQNSNGEKHVFMSSIPSIEGVFYEDDGNHDGLHNSVQGSASYNYGNNYISHVFYDIVPWFVMDKLFP